MLVRSTLVAAILALSVPTVLAQTGAQPKSVDAARPTSTGAVPQDTLDDFIAGFNGDTEAMNRAMKATDDLLAKDPNNVEALAWNASGKGAMCGAAFGSGDFKKGMQLWTESKQGLNRSVELAPENVTIRIVRGKTMLESSLHDPMPMSSREAAATAVNDLETAVKLMGEEFEKEQGGFRKEMYAWLYQAASKAGDKEKAEKYKKLAGEKAGEAADRLNQSAENTVIESARAALVILESPLTTEIKPDLLARLRAPSKLDAVIAALDAKNQAKPNDAAPIAWRGFTRILRTSSMFAQGKIEEAAKTWEKGNAEINAAASQDATSGDALLLRALSNLEKTRRESDPERRTEGAQKTLTDLARFDRMLKDGGASLSTDGSAYLHLTIARAQMMKGDFKKAREELTAARAANPAADIAKRATSLIQLLDVIEKKD
jgi:hypothetical protein